MTDDLAKAIFLDALDLPAASRGAFVARACGDDADLRASVERLLGAHAAADDFLEKPASVSDLAGIDPRREPAIQLERPGDRVGPFELVARIGEGGFGTVWRARQIRPVVRQVAVKVVKLGMDTVEVVRRFEQERDLLARLDHPSIAKVFDAGATADGRPWFAMELVDGEPITDFADRHTLSQHRRIELFVEVCRAIQYAHHQGVIHRDIKPSNVLVGQHDGRPEPRVIDFGIAKALDRSGAQHTLFSRERQLLGTPEYMSPEQVETWGAAVDARTDVYSLGVLLYELLTGSRPYDLRRIGAGRFEELLRQIREVPAERPTARLATLPPDRALRLARNRGLAGAREHGRRLRGDLDWILLRALEKDRDRRYATPTELAADLRRHLRDEPVTAGPPDLGYRLAKLARRHRTGVALAGIALSSLVIGSAFAVDGMLRAWRSEQKERVARERAEQRSADAERALTAVESLLGAADPRAVHGSDYRVRDLLDEFATRMDSDASPRTPAVEARLRRTLGRTYRMLGEADSAQRHLAAALALQDQDPEASLAESMATRRDLAWVWHQLGRNADALRELEPVLAHHRGRRAEAPLEYAATLDALATFRSRLGELTAAREAADESWQLCVEHLGPHHPDTLRSRIRVIEVRMLEGGGADVRPELARLRERLARHLPERHPDLLTIEHQLGVAHETAGELDAAADHYGTALEGRLAIFGEASPAVARTRVALGWVHKQRGELEPAIELLIAGRDGLVAAHGADHVDVARANFRLGDALSLAGRHEDAVARITAAIDVLGADADPPVDELLAAHANLALARWRSGDRTVAVEGLAATLPGLEARMSRATPTGFIAWVNLGRMQQQLAHRDAAGASYTRAAEIGAALWPDGHPQRDLVERWREELAERR